MQREIGKQYLKRYVDSGAAHVDLVPKWKRISNIFYRRESPFLYVSLAESILESLLIVPFSFCFSRQML